MSILPQLLVNALISGSICALASSGLALTYGLLRVLNFAHGHFMMAGAYCFYAAYVQADLGLFQSMIVTLVFSLALGWFTLLVFVQPFTKYSTMLPFVTTLALSNILESLVSIIFGVNVKSLSLSGGGVESMQIGSVYITPLQITIISSAIVSLLILAIVIHLTPFGRKLRAMSERGVAAESLGIDSRKLKFFIFGLSSVFASFAGVMIGFETNLQPTMGGSYTIKAFAAMLLGGLGNIWGTVLGSFVLALVENLSIGLDFWGYSLPAGYKDAFAFVIILLVLLVRPQGIFGSKLRVA